MWVCGGVCVCVWCVVGGLMGLFSVFNFSAIDL